MDLLLTAARFGRSAARDREHGRGSPRPWHAGERRLM